MTEAEWLACKGSDDWRLFTADMQACLRGQGSIRKLVLFSFACCRRISIIDPRCLCVLDVAERYVDDLANEDEWSQAFQTSQQTMNDFVQMLNHRDIPPDEPLSNAHLFNCAIVLCKINEHARVVESASYIARHAQTTARHAHQPDGEAMERGWQARVLCDVLGRTESPINPSWLTSTVLGLARGIYEEKYFDRLPILADALQDAGCDNEDILNHCRCDGVHIKGCFVVDLLLGKE